MNKRQYPPLVILPTRALPKWEGFFRPTTKHLSRNICDIEQSSSSETRTCECRTCLNENPRGVSVSKSTYYRHNPKKWKRVADNTVGAYISFSEFFILTIYINIFCMMQILDNPVLDPTHGSDISDPLQGTDPPDDESLNAQTK